jgi:hypothetical protein
MTRSSAVRKFAGPRGSVAWGKTLSNQTVNRKNAGVMLFAAMLIVCSLAVGCSKENPKPVSSNISAPQTPSPAPVSTAPAPVMQAAAKPTAKKAVKRPANVTYADTTNGISFDYPRRYALETGNAATDLVASSPLPMNFVQPGGVALAAVEVPMTGFANTDFSSAFFNVSVHKTLTAETCQEFSVTKAPSAPVESATSTQTTSASVSNPTETASATTSASSQSQPTKLMIGKLELQGTETVVGDNGRNTEAKYFHVFQNGACYEFALNLTTSAPDKEVETKQVDRKQIFDRLEKILATVKIAPVEATPEVTASAPAAATTVPASTQATAAPAAPAQ